MSESVQDRADDAASTVRDSRALDMITVIGLVTFGLVHLVVGWIALQLAFGERAAGGSADQQGALRQLASTPLGPVLLWAVAAGLFALVLWRLSQVVWGYAWISDTSRRTRKRVAALAQAVIYLLLGISAARVAAGGQGGGGNEARRASASGCCPTRPAWSWWSPSQPASPGWASRRWSRGCATSSPRTYAMAAAVPS